MTGFFNKAYWSLFTFWNVRDEKKIAYHPLEEVISIQNRRVRAIVAHAYETVPYYREVMDSSGLTPGDFRTADDLSRLPILSGPQLISAPERFLSNRYARGRNLQLRSTGSTGPPKYVYYDPVALFLAMAHGHRRRVALAHYVGRSFGYKQMSARSPQGVVSLLMDYFQAHAWIPRKVDLKRCNLSTRDSFEENIARINAFKPDVFTTFGSYAGAIFRRAWEAGLYIFRPKVVLYGGDAMAPENRRLIETEFRVPVLSSYQAVEALNLAYQCERREGLHIHLDELAVRVVDSNGNTLGPETPGEIVISNLTNRATVLLNYKLGDLVRLNSLPCPCGRTLPTLELLEGRTGDMVILPEGRALPADEVLAPLLYVPGIVQVQLTQEELRHFSLLAVCAAVADWEQVRQGLDSALRSELGDEITVEIMRVDAIPPGPGGKVSPFVLMISSAS